MAEDADADLAAIIALIQENYDYPVDSVLISAEGEVVGHVNVHEATAREPSSYRAFLRRGLALAAGELEPEQEQEQAPPPPPSVRGAKPPVRPGVLTLTPEAPSGSLLQVVRRREFGQTSMLFLSVDAQAFTEGGEIVVEIRLGDAECAGKFELCAPSGGGVSPVETLDALQPGQSGELTYRFEKGALFMLAVQPAAGAEVGAVNAFLAKVSVRAKS